MPARSRCATIGRPRSHTAALGCPRARLQRTGLLGAVRLPACACATWRAPCPAHCAMRTERARPRGMPPATSPRPQTRGMHTRGSISSSISKV
eukprot:5580538-Prymnesium_polylepis.1